MEVPGVASVTSITLPNEAADIPYLEGNVLATGRRKSLLALRGLDFFVQESVNRRRICVKIRQKGERHMSPSSPPSPITTTPKRRRRTSLGDFNQLLGLDGVVPLTSGAIPEGSEAVLYLRVSTARQMNTAIDIDEGGNSIA